MHAARRAGGEEEGTGASNNEGQHTSLYQSMCLDPRLHAGKRTLSYLRAVIYFSWQRADLRDVCRVLTILTMAKRWSRQTVTQKSHVKHDAVRFFFVIPTFCAASCRRSCCNDHVPKCEVAAVGYLRKSMTGRSRCILHEQQVFRPERLYVNTAKRVA